MQRIRRNWRPAGHGNDRHRHAAVLAQAAQAQRARVRRRHGRHLPLRGSLQRGIAGRGGTGKHRLPARQSVAATGNERSQRVGDTHFPSNLRGLGAARTVPPTARSLDRAVVAGRRAVPGTAAGESGNHRAGTADVPAAGRMAAGRRGAGRTGLRVDAGKNGPDAAAPLATDARGRAQCQARTRAGRGPSLAGREPGAGCFGGGLRVHRDHRHGTGAVAALAGELPGV
ncbi:hypothetical protein G6F40_013991 [Rhizopus arrhizus]|nr:hypothetical protein G6F40_013991 [Rhizopus arrhizus]